MIVLISAQTINLLANLLCSYYSLVNEMKLLGGLQLT